MFINVPYVYRFAVSLSFLSRDNDTDLRQLSRGFKWLNNAAEKRRQPSGQRALDTLTAYITVNVAIDAIDAGKRLKGDELADVQAETRDTVEILSGWAQIR